MAAAVTERTTTSLRATLAAVAPGTALRDGLERILRGRTGALIVLGYDQVVEQLCTGGFPLDVEFSATRLRELAKMDGAIVLDRDCTRILRAAVQLVPDPSIATERVRHPAPHRRAGRPSRPATRSSRSASRCGSSRSTSAAGGYVLEDSTAILSRANQALATLERYKLRLDEVAGTLSALEIEDLVTVRDVAAVLQRLEMVRRIADEIDELRRRARHRRPAAHPAARRADRRRRAATASWSSATTCPTGRRPRTARATSSPTSTRSTPTELLDLAAVARVARLRRRRRRARRRGQPARLPAARQGARACPAPIVDRLVEHFGSLQKLLAASIDDLQAVDGVGEAAGPGRPRGPVPAGRVVSILERYV